MPTALYALFFVMLFICTKSLILYHNSFPVLLLETIGRSSYCIFLIQMTYYFLVAHAFFSEPPLWVSILICILLGCSYSKLDNYIQTNKLIRK